MILWVGSEGVRTDKKTFFMVPVKSFIGILELSSQCTEALRCSRGKGVLNFASGADRNDCG